MSVIDSQKNYQALTPDTLLCAVDSVGYQTSGRLLALNSYENRVYRCELEQGGAVIAKFYRPQRWSNAAIEEEHQFSLQLEAEEIPVVAPLMIKGKTLHEYAGYRFSIFPLRGGRWPELAKRQDLNWMGRYIARIHVVGGQDLFNHRQQIELDRMAVESANYLQTNDFIPVYLSTAYQTLTDDLIVRLKEIFHKNNQVKMLRLHGDCHRSNVLWTEKGPHFVDLDDCCNGPAIQDIWMLLCGDRGEMTEQLCDLLEGYEEFLSFDVKQLNLIEALRTLRMMHYSAWLAKRWHDPAFLLAFPWFNTTAYWEQHILELREQFSRLDEPTLIV